MRRISPKKMIVTALAVGSLGVLGAVGALTLRPFRAQPERHEHVGPARHRNDRRRPTDGPGDQAESATKSAPESASEAKEAPEVKGQDTDQVQQGDQSRPDTPSSSTPGPVLVDQGGTNPKAQQTSVDRNHRSGRRSCA